MNAQHFLPAAYIGRFSTAKGGRLRERPVWVQRVGRTPYRASAEYVGHARGLYDGRHPWANEVVSRGKRLTVDTAWKYEPRLPAALDALADRTTPLDAKIWAEVLVPFVSSLFIRGIDFKSRYESRIPGVTGPGPAIEEPLLEDWHANTIGSGQIEWQRLLAPTIAARWWVLHGSGAPVLPTNDVARCIASNPRNPGQLAYAIPVDPSTVLMLEPRPVRRIVDWDGERWVTALEHYDTTDEGLAGCGAALQQCAFREVYGPTRASVVFPHPAFEPGVGPVGPELLYCTPHRLPLTPYLLDYFQLLTVLQLPPTFDSVEIDWSVVARHWAGIVQRSLNAPSFPGGLANLTITDPQGRQRMSVYEDMTRFSVEDVASAIGSESTEFSEELSPALTALIGLTPAS